MKTYFGATGKALISLTSSHGNDGSACPNETKQSRKDRAAAPAVTSVVSYLPSDFEDLSWIRHGFLADDHVVVVDVLEGALKSHESPQQRNSHLMVQIIALAVQGVSHPVSSQSAERNNTATSNTQWITALTARKVDGAT